MDGPLHLCETCRHCRLVRTPRSTFYLCRRHETQPDRFRRYPPVPVLRCAGYDAGEDETQGEA